MTVLPRPRTSHRLPMSRWPYRLHRSEARNEVDKALTRARNVHSRALITRSGARTEFSALLYATKHFLATSQLVATRNPNASLRTINSGILQRFIHTLTVYTPCSPRSCRIQTPLIPEGTLQTCYASQQTASWLPQTPYSKAKSIKCERARDHDHKTTSIDKGPHCS